MEKLSDYVYLWDNGWRHGLKGWWRKDNPDTFYSLEKAMCLQRMEDYDKQCYH